jgi:hypothetical protein
MIVVTTYEYIMFCIDTVFKQNREWTFTYKQCLNVTCRKLNIRHTKNWRMFVQTVRY